MALGEIFGGLGLFGSSSDAEFKADYERHLNQLNQAQQNAMHQQYTQTAAQNAGWGQGLGQQATQQRREPDLDVLVTPNGRPIGPEWRGAAIVRVRVANSSAWSKRTSIAFMSKGDNIEAELYLDSQTPTTDVRDKATFYVELLNQWRVGEVSVSIEI